MLQKEFFQVQPFNPNPYQDNVIVDLSGAQKFEADTVFYPGRYSVIVNAGSSIVYGSNGTVGYLGKPVIIQKDIAVREKFLVRAYCGGASVINFSTMSGSVGTNPYLGEFKVNGLSTCGVTPQSVSHIFGNAGSAGRFVNSGTPHIPSDIASGGNCLGDGVFTSRGTLTYFSASSAGSCLHLLPLGGTFGTDYLFAFHSAGVAGNGQGVVIAGGGSAYGGGASGGIWGSGTSGSGGASPYGIGGAGVTNISTGNNGTGIGNGKNNGLGAGAYFDGTNWNDETTYVTTETQGKIKITYLGPINE